MIQTLLGLLRTSANAEAKAELIQSAHPDEVGDEWGIIRAGEEVTIENEIPPPHKDTPDRIKRLWNSRLITKPHDLGDGEYRVTLTKKGAQYVTVQWYFGATTPKQVLDRESTAHLRGGPSKRSKYQNLKRELPKRGETVLDYETDAK